MSRKIIAGVFVLILLALVALGLTVISSYPSITGNVVCTGDNCGTKSDITNAPVKEFVMESFVEFVDGNPKPQFSLKEITVNKGDLVRLRITVTKGTHDFKIDEFDVYADTPLNNEVIVEFVADKSGEFVYYCTKPGHRENGHWGTLKVQG